MSEQQHLDALKKVADVASLAGIRGQVNEEQLHFETGFQLPGNRSQMVYIRVAGQDMNGLSIVTFFSPCLIVEKGFLKGISKKQALDLLRKNEQVMFARYGIWSAESNDMIVASVDQLLDTLDPQEFEAHALHVALAADQYEQLHGKDVF